MTPFEGHDYPQVIPTPEEVAPGRPAPWAHLDPSQRRHLTVARVTEALARRGQLFTQGSPPSEPAELAAIVAATEGVVARRSAVLVALFDEYDEARVVLTRRSAALRNHRNEVALPGGRCDPDEDATATALREAMEEVALDPSSVEVIGWLTPIVTLASGSAIQPVVGVVRSRPSLRANPTEVARVFDVALTDLAADGNFIEQRWRRSTPRAGSDSEGWFPLSFFKVPGEVIWGATGRVLTELVAAVTGTDDGLAPGVLREG